MVAGAIGGWLILEAKIRDEVKVAMKDPEIRKELIKGDPGARGPEGISIPVGGIVPYAGVMKFQEGSFVLPEEVAACFEICDGEVVSTPGSSILGLRKPPLMGKFLRGMTATEIPTLSVQGKDRSYP